LKSRPLATAFSALVLALAATVQAGAAAIPVASAARPATAAMAAASPTGSWTKYHLDSGHTGYDSAQPAVAGASTGWVSPTLDGSVYGEPLVYNGLVYVSTLQNTVYALNQSTGAVVWSRNLGAPQTSGWQCGNINPTGILGTGIIDTSASRIYVAAFLHQFLSYYLFGLNLATGTIALETQVSPNGFQWQIQQERGALALSTDGTHVYVPFGGRAGDCGPYHTWVDGVPTNGGAPDELWKGPSTGAGSWAAGGVVVDDSTGHVFFATGNAIPCSGATFSDSIIETNATLGGLSYFQPLDWEANWCGPDSDLGSASPVLISPSLMFTAGKFGQGFLLKPTALGGTGGQLFPAQSPYNGADVCFGNHSDATFGSFAYAAGRVYIECEGHGLVSLAVDTAAPSFSLCDATCPSTGTWQAGGGATFGPPIIAGGVVWVADINGGGLFGFDAATGAQIFNSAGFGVTHFTTPSEAGGQLFVASDNVVRSFNMVAGCSSMSAAPQPASPSAVGTPVVVTGSASGVGSGCPNPRYAFYLLPPGGSWTPVQAYSPTATYNWSTMGLPAGTYRFSVWARDASSGNGYDSFSAFDYMLTSPSACTGMSASSAPPASAEVGTGVTVTGTATGCANPRYAFYLLPPGGSWSLVQAYSAGATFKWTTAGSVPGVYRFSVWARDASSSAAYDSFSAFDYTLTTCSAMTATPAPATGTSIGTPVTVTGSAGGCSAPLYEFWLHSPGGTWSLARGYSGTATYNWNTSGQAPGVYRFSVWARDTNSAGSVGTSPFNYDVFSAFDYTLTSPSACTGMSASAVPANTASRGTTVTVTGSATGCGAPQYEFWLHSPAGAWTLAQGWSSSPSFMWPTTAAMPVGTYRFSVWARDASSPGTVGSPPYTYDVFSAFDYVLTTTPCTGASASAVPANTASRGTTVTVTGGATGCTAPQFEFWLKSPDGTWTLVQSWSSNTSFSWKTTIATTAGTYRFSVWVRDASSGGTTGSPPYTYDTLSAFDYTLS
jgi:hypothetical protein